MEPTRTSLRAAGRKSSGVDLRQQPPALASASIVRAPSLGTGTARHHQQSLVMQRREAGHARGVLQRMRGWRGTVDTDGEDAVGGAASSEPRRCLGSCVCASSRVGRFSVFCVVCALECWYFCHFILWDYSVRSAREWCVDYVYYQVFRLRILSSILEYVYCQVFYTACVGCVDCCFTLCVLAWYTIAFFYTACGHSLVSSTLLFFLRVSRWS